MMLSLKEVREIEINEWKLVKITDPKKLQRITNEINEFIAGKKQYTLKELSEETRKALGIIKKTK